MFIDSQMQLSDAQALTATAASTNEIDFGGDFDIGRGEPMAVVFTVDVAADVADADETYQFDVRTDDNAAMSSAVVIGSRTIAGSLLTAGSTHIIPLPLVNERYLDVNYTLGGTTPSLTVTSFLQPMSMIDSANVYYADGFTIT